MSEWITDRLPTFEDACNSGAFVLTCNKNEVFGKHFAKILESQPWMPYPKPYVEPKQVRRRLFNSTRNEVRPYRGNCDDTEYVEVLPDDPDLDELIAAAQDVVKDHTNGMNEIHPQNVQRLNEALKPRNEK